MKEEELLKKLESVELPEIEIESHRNWLRTALLTTGYTEKRWGVIVYDSVKSRIKAAIAIITRGFTSQQPVWKVAIISICVVVLVASGTWILLNREWASAETLVKLSRIEIEALVSDLTPGKTLYMREQTYQRYGPAAPRIMEGSWYLPESRFGEQWLQVDEDGNFYCFQSAVTDSDGNVWQESMTVDGEQLIRSINTGEETWSRWRPYPVTQYMNSALSLPEKLLDRGWELVGDGEWDGRETTVFEKHSYWVNHGTNLEQGYVIPWVADLDAVEIIFRFEIVSDNPLFYSEEMWVANATGERTLVEQHRRINIEVLDEPPPLELCPPPYVIRTFTLNDADEVLDLESLLPARFKRIGAASEGLSREDLGLDSIWSDVVMYRSDVTDELVYAYLTIMPEPADEQARTEVIEGIKAGAPGDFHQSAFGTDAVESDVADFVRNPNGGGYGGAYSDDDGWEYGNVRVDRVFVAIYRISQFQEKEPLSQLAEVIWRRLNKFDQ